MVGSKPLRHRPGACRRIEAAVIPRTAPLRPASWQRRRRLIVVLAFKGSAEAGVSLKAWSWAAQRTAGRQKAAPCVPLSGLNRAAVPSGSGGGVMANRGKR